MLTLAQLTGAAVVLATFQVTFWLVSTAHVAALLGAVTAKGPAPFSTVTDMVASFTPPRPSRAVRRNCMVRSSDGSDSPVLLFDPSRMLFSVGKVRVAAAPGRCVR